MSISNPTPSAPATPTLSRTNLILAAILLLQLALTAYFYWPTQGATTTGEHLLAEVTPDAVTALSITDNNGRSVNFVKEGDIWTLADTDGYPARAQKITETLDKLTAITTDRLVTQTAGSHDRLQVAEGNYLRQVEITTAEGTHTLYFGSSTGVSATHVRAADNAVTYLTNEVATWELDTLATTWIEVAYFKVPKAQISEITLENANGSFTFVPADDSGEDTTQWTLADASPDEPIAPANINTFIDRIATLNLHTVLGKSESPDYGLATPLATITVTTSDVTASDVTTATTPADVKTTTVVIGAKDEEENTYYLKSSDSEFYVRLAAFTGDDLVNKQRSDFMVQSDASSENASVAPATTEPPSAEPVSSSDVTTNSVDTSTPVTATVTSDDTATAEATIEATNEATATVSASSTVTDTVTPEIDATTEPDATALPTN